MTNQSDKSDVGAYRLDIDGELPLTTLMASRLSALELTKAGLACRMGYEATVAKGVRRLEALLAGDLRHYSNLKEPLAKGMAVEGALLDEAVADTRYVLWARDDRAYRREFTPHVVWKTTLSIPSPTTIAGFINARRGLFWYPGVINPACISEAATSAMPEGVACYGRATGFYVNYSPDCAVRFNQQGEALETFDHAIRPGYASASVAGRPLNLTEVT